MKRVRLPAILALMIAGSPAAQAQAAGGPVEIAFGWPAGDRPQQILLPNDGEHPVMEANRASVTLTRPAAGERRYAVEILYGDGTSYPLELRLLAVSRPATIQLSRVRRDSCSNNNLKPFEAPTAGTVSSIRAAFSVQFLLSRGTEDNSCASWPLRAKKARHDRYCNMMTSSEVLVVPAAIRAQFRDDAAGNAAIIQDIEKCELAEGRRKTIVLQQAAIAETRSGNALEAYVASAALSEEASAANADDLVYSQISQTALERQTSDLRLRAIDVAGDAAVQAIDTSIAAEMATPR